jgi:hypothetical protein
VRGATDEGTHLRDVQVRGQACLVGHFAGLARVVEDEAGVDGARPRGAREIVEGREAHGGVEGAALLDPVRRGA